MYRYRAIKVILFVYFRVDNVSVLLVEEIGAPGETHWPATNHRQTLSHNVVLSTSRHDRDSYVCAKKNFKYFHPRLVSG
jgi:hypothetical protein